MHPEPAASSATSPVPAPEPNARLVALASKRGLRVAVTGSPALYALDWVRAVLDRMHTEQGISCIIHRGRFGAEVIAHAWAVERGVPVHQSKIRRQTYGRNALAFSEEDLFEKGRPDVMLVFAGDTHANLLAAKAQRRGVLVFPFNAQPAALAA